jgi:hypothetical protein
VNRSPWLPFALLLGFGATFASAALGGGLLIFDDHPGQLFRLWHGFRRGLLPWEWNPDWWAGYPELQFYPPGYVLMGGLLHLASLKSLGPETTYQLLLWITYLLPGITTFWLMARVCQNPWLALPTALVVLTMSAESRSGVEGGLRTGMIAARLGVGLLPLLALSLSDWQERGGKPPVWTAPLLAAIVVTHPAHAVAGVVLVLLSLILAPPGEAQRRRMIQTVRLLAVAAGLTGFWTIPLLAHIHYALPLAWGDFSFGSLGLQIVNRPLLAIAVLGSAVALGLAFWSGVRSRSTLILAALPPALLITVVIDALIVEPWGIRWLPSDRLLDSLYLALVLSAGLSIGWLSGRFSRIWLWPISLTVLLLSFLPAGQGEPDLTLWPGPGQWPMAGETVRKLEMDQLWEEIRRAPPGRILFIRSGVPLVSGKEWYRPHTHLTALTPMFTGREILNGTFTHPSPIAGLIYTGSATEPIRQLVETLDGRRLFGQPIEGLSREVFESLSLRLRISCVVALNEDLGRLRFVEENPAFGPPRMVGPFALFCRTEALSTPEPVGPRRFRLRLPESRGGWVPVGVAFYPLWRAEGPNGPLPLRRDPWGLMEVGAPAGRNLQIKLVYREGLWEWLGLVVSGVAAIVWTATTWLGPKSK